MTTNTGGNCVVYTDENPRPPWYETDDCKDLEFAISLLNHSDSNVSQIASEIVNLYNQLVDEGSTIARCGISEGIGRRLNTLSDLGFRR